MVKRGQKGSRIALKAIYLIKRSKKGKSARWRHLIPFKRNVVSLFLDEFFAHMLKDYTKISS